MNNDKLALSSTIEQGEQPNGVRALSISARSNYPYRIKVNFLPAWKSIEFKATLHDLDGPLYNGRGPTACAALMDLLSHPTLISHRTFDVELSERANAKNPVTEKTDEGSANTK